MRVLRVCTEDCSLYWESVHEIAVFIEKYVQEIVVYIACMYRRLWSILGVCTGDCGLYWEYVQEIIVVLHKYVYLIFLQPSSVVENHLSFYSWSLRACFNFYGSGESNLAIGMHR